jgi:hypothetical protein
MVIRYICPACRNVYKSKHNCQQTGCSVIKKNYDHTEFGILMYIFCIIGIVMIFLAFIIGSGWYVIYSFIPIGIGLVFNLLDDRKISQIAQRDLAIIRNELPEPTSEHY